MKQFFLNSNLISKFWDFYSKILSLPMIYNPKNIITLLVILIIAFLSLCFNFCYKLEITFSNEIGYILITAVVFNLMLIKFNLIKLLR